MMNTCRKLPEKSKGKLKCTARKPLRDVSNDIKVSSTSCIQKKLPEAYKKEKEEKSLAGNQNGSIDRLRIIHADLSSLVRQIDELLVQALKLTDEEGIKEIDAFANVLSEMQTSLEPWVPRFQKAVSNLSTAPPNLVEEPVATTVGLVNDSIGTLVKSPEETELDELVSPSPLVSWRADCVARDGRQLFLLTPLPRRKEQHASLDVIGKNKKDILEVIPGKPSPMKPVSPETSQKMDSHMFVMTPCLKISPPKSCVLLEPISRFPQKKSQGVHQPTPFPAKIQKFDASQDSESSSSQVSCDNKPMKYPEFLEITLGYNYGNRRQAVEESPNWLLSPPKTCVLMEPSDNELLNAAINDHPLPNIASVSDQGANNVLLTKQNNIQVGHPEANESRKQGHGIGSETVEYTPMLLESAYTIRTGKQKGENTLKKELWTKFEAVSRTGIHFNDSTSQTASQRGFLDLLDEVS